MGDSSGKNRVVSDNVIMAIAQQLGDAGTFVGRSLGISDPDIKCIQKENQGNLKEMNYQILLKWRQQSASKATKARLASALKKYNRRDLVERYLKGSSAKKGITKGAEKKAKNPKSSKDEKVKKMPVSKSGATPAGSRATKGITKGAEKKAKTPNTSKDEKEKKMPISKRGATPAGSSAQKTTTKRKSTTKMNPSKGPKQQKVPAKKATKSAQKSRKKKETAKRGSTSKRKPPKDSEEKMLAEIGRAVLEQAVLEGLADRG